MGKKKLEFSLFALFDGGAALRGLRSFSRSVSRTMKSIATPTGLGAGVRSQRPPSPDL